MKAAAPRPRRRWIAARLRCSCAPVLVFAVVGAFLRAGPRPAIRRLPSALIGQARAAISRWHRSRGATRLGFKRADLGGRPVLVNFLRSWCVPCLVEHPLISMLADAKASRSIGINYKDKPGDGAALLTRLGNPFAKLGGDGPGRDRHRLGRLRRARDLRGRPPGPIRHRQAGPLMPRDVEQTIKPLLARCAMRMLVLLLCFWSAAGPGGDPPDEMLADPALEAARPRDRPRAALRRLPEPVDRRFRCADLAARPAPAGARAADGRRQRRRRS